MSLAQNRLSAIRVASIKPHCVKTKILITRIWRRHTSLAAWRRRLFQMPRTLVRFLVIFGWVGAAMAGQTEDFADSVRAIRSVGPEGRGNAEAAAAWKKLAGGDATTLVPILASMDGANDFALNWLRAAADAVAGRASSAWKRSWRSVWAPSQQIAGSTARAINSGSKNGRPTTPFALVRPKN
jgi:hypothetical protein